MKRFLEIGGVAAGVVLIAFGVAAIVLGMNGKSTVSTELKNQQIVGTPDMTPKAIAGEVKAAGLKNVDLPSCSVAGQTVSSASDIQQALVKYHPGDKISVNWVDQNGQSQTATVTLASGPAA